MQLARLIEPALLGRQSLEGGFALGTTGTSACPAEAPLRCEGNGNVGCCPAESTCHAAPRPYCCTDDDDDCLASIRSAPHCAVAGWNMYANTDLNFCCRPGEIGVLPQNSASHGLCLSGTQEVPTDRLATMVSQIGGTAVTPFVTPTATAPTTGSTSSGAPPSQTSTSSGGGGGSSISGGAIAGIVIGAIFLLVICVGVLLWWHRRSLRKKPSSPTVEPNNPEMKKQPQYYNAMSPVQPVPYSSDAGDSSPMHSVSSPSDAGRRDSAYSDPRYGRPAEHRYSAVSPYTPTVPEMENTERVELDAQDTQWSPKKEP